MAEEAKVGTPEAQKEKKKNKWTYILSVLVVLVMTGLSLGLSLANGGAESIADAIRTADAKWVWVTAGLVFVSYCIDALIIQIFARLYTRQYKFHQGLANAMIGTFYSDVTPGASGGQVMQVYTLKTQGVEVSNGASIMVMWFILYQIALLIFDAIAFIFEGQTIIQIGTFNLPIGTNGSNVPIHAIPLIILGFVVNLSVLALLFLMSYSHRFHNFIMHYVIGFLGKIKLVKNPDKTRENLRVQVENFKIELRRLQTNIPVTILVVSLFLVCIFIRYSIPYFDGLALNAFQGSTKPWWQLLFKGTFYSAFHQMMAGLIPLPGASGVSEFFFTVMFGNDYYLGVDIYDADGFTILVTASADLAKKLAAGQILWRFMTFYVPLVIGGLFALFYKSRPKEGYVYANRQTFVNLQLETFDERKLSSDTLYETRQLSKKSIAQKLKDSDFADENEDEELPYKKPKTKKKKRNDVEVGD
jgi:glycosyltransferase 2 family protein